MPGKLLTIMEEILLIGKFDKKTEIYPKEYILVNYLDLFRVLHNRGNHYFSGLNAQLNIERSKRDDMEGIGYILIFFLRGNLPWMQYKPKLGVLDFFH